MKYLKTVEKYLKTKVSAKETKVKYLKEKVSAKTIKMEYLKEKMSAKTAQTRTDETKTGNLFGSMGSIQ